MKTELVETRGDRERVEEAGERDGFEGTADHRPGGYEHPWSGHTNALNIISTTCRDLGVKNRFFIDL